MYNYITVQYFSNLFLYFRAQIERENKDIRLEQIRLKAVEQRETILQSLK